jgi:RNA polymerase sigma-70 factor (ECF subfamily)
MSYSIELDSGNKTLQRSRQLQKARMSDLGHASIDDTARAFRLFLEGDDTAFVQLYELHNQKIYTYCAKILRDYAAAQDITHSVWEKVIALRISQPKVENPAGFFFRIARNLCLDYRKHLHFQTSFDNMTEASHPSAPQLSPKEEIVIETLNGLRGDIKEIFILHYYSGYSFEEIATILGKSPNAIWTRVSRGRKELKKIIIKELRKEERKYQ